MQKKLFTGKDFGRRFLLFLTGLFISALGVAVTKKGELGVSPVSSVANVLSIRFQMLTMGNWLIIWNCILILGQILILRKEFELFQLLQIPLSFLFGYFTDLNLWLVRHIPSESYPLRIGCVLLGSFFLGFGIAMTVRAGLIMNSGEAFVKAVSDKGKRDFSTMKIVFDITNVILSVLLSLLFCRGRIVGTREGTVLAAFLTGICVKLGTKILDKLNVNLTK